MTYESGQKLTIPCFLHGVQARSKSQYIPLPFLCHLFWSLLHLWCYGNSVCHVSTQGPILYQMVVHFSSFNIAMQCNSAETEESYLARALAFAESLHPPPPHTCLQCLRTKQNAQFKESKQEKNVCGLDSVYHQI